MGTLRPLTTVDVPRVLEIQASAYEPHLLESADVFMAKIAAHPRHCLGWEDDRGLLGAYVIAFPMAATASVGLHETEPRPVASRGASPILYVHDMAVDPILHATGIGGLVAHELIELARAGGQLIVELVAIESAAAFWERQGFVVTGDAVYPGYGPGARKMRLKV